MEITRSQFRSASAPGRMAVSAAPGPQPKLLVVGSALPSRLAASC